MRKKPETILALDPGLRDLGYAVLSGKELVMPNVLPLRSVHPRRRLQRVEKAIEAWIRAYHPDVLVVEQIPKRPLDSLAGLPALGRLIRRIAGRRRIKFVTYSAKTARRTVVGDGWAGKKEVAEAICTRFPDLRVHLTQNRKWKERYWQNMFDAIALALHHQAVMKPPSRSRLSG